MINNNLKDLHTNKFIGLCTFLVFCHVSRNETWTIKIGRQGWVIKMFGITDEETSKGLGALSFKKEVTDQNSSGQ